MCKSECTDYVCFEVNRRVLFNGKSAKGLVGGSGVVSHTKEKLIWQQTQVQVLKVVLYNHVTDMTLQ